VDAERVTDELYALPLGEFTAARDARVSEARRAGDTALASTLKTLRKPTVGAWLANLLTRVRTKDIHRLIALGAELRDGRRPLDGDQIRRVSKERAEIVARLARDATNLASRRNQAVSESALRELEATLDAAFADAASAESLRAGRLTTALQYSGLGLLSGVSADAGSPRRRTPAVRRPTAALREAERAAERANRDAARADAELEGARQALRAAERRAKDADKKAASAERTLVGLRRQRPG